MPEILHQQRLLLELLVKSGDIGISDCDDGSILYRTLQEALQEGWITIGPFGAGVEVVRITDSGRAVVKDRRNTDKNYIGNDRRRTSLNKDKH